jgi:prepilin-type N-terminal cleavage/methylation domain-containing protein
MKLRLSTTRRTSRGFSLLEMMIAVGMLTIVILALYAMFDQTQKALRQALNQVDVSEGGRSALDLIVRRAERAASPQVQDSLNLVIKPANAIGYSLVFDGQEAVADRTRPLRFDEVFFTYPIAGGLWHVAGFFVAPDQASPTTNTTTVGLSSLYLIDEALPNTNLVRALDSANLIPGGSSDPATIPPLRLSGTFAVQTNLLTGRVVTPAFPSGTVRADAVRLIEGVIQFRVTAFDADGRPYDRTHPIIADLAAPRAGANTNRPVHRIVTPDSWLSTNQVSGISRPLPISIEVVDVETGQVNAQFRGTNLPTALEIEVTLLDGKQLDQFRSLPETVDVRNRWLANNSGAIQTLRQRVALRTAPQ